MPPATPKVGTALDPVNDAFHDAYDAARDLKKHEAPVIVVMGDELAVFHRGERHDHRFVPRLSHVIKSTAHAPIALFAILQGDADPAPGLAALAAHVAASEQSLDDERAPAESPDALDDVRTVLVATSAFLERARSGTTSRAELDAFAKATGPCLLALTTHATRLQLASLEAQVDGIMKAFDDDERRALQVVVTGDHQARKRSLGMQYFGRRLGEERVTYGEGVEDADEAFALIGKHRLDETIALAFFGDSKRLQQDVLGDAVKTLLAERDK